MDSIEELPKRIIKFRAWCTVDKMMYCDIQGGIKFDDGSVYGFHNFLDPHPNGYHNWKLIQFTGLLDKNGKEIYEHDRVRVLYTDWPSKDSNDPRSLEQYLIDISRIGVVVFHGLGWCVKFDGDRYDTLIVGTHGRLEVIGNIYQS